MMSVSRTEFLRCRSCEEILRRIPELPPAEDEDLLSFRERHARCEIESLVPTGRAIADRPWHEPFAERRVEVRGPSGTALLVGRRTSLDEPVAWTFEPGDLDEVLEISLDGPAFWEALDEALRPHHFADRPLRRWAEHVSQLVRDARAEDVIVLEDDPHVPAVSRGALTPTASARLQSSLRSFGVDEFTAERLSSAFTGARFPPLRITRRLVTASPGPGGGGEGRVSAGGGVPPAES